MATRPETIGTTVRQVISPALRECPPSCGIVTITEVAVSKDCSYATVYISALQSPNDALAYLEEKRDEFQKTLFHALQRFRAPIIRFRVDRVAEKVSRIDQLLDEAT
jgi:ribosome-binding factor A